MFPSLRSWFRRQALLVLFERGTDRLPGIGEWMIFIHPKYGKLFGIVEADSRLRDHLQIWVPNVGPEGTQFDVPNAEVFLVSGPMEVNFELLKLAFKRSK